MADFTHEIYRYLNSANLKHSNLGYTYLFAVIKKMLENESSVKISDIYSQVAEEYKTSSICVERAIRYTILEKNITNKEFIMRACHEIKYGVYNSRYAPESGAEASKAIS